MYLDSGEAHHSHSVLSLKKLRLKIRVRYGGSSGGASWAGSPLRPGRQLDWK